ncbi:cyclase family protein [Paenibacillus spongiae]|uniref:Cyclase family protein n=1 Tax=Paenibacillus spongiae TaxID=2909671 RepID=A0ABY5S797_9BACL|nr:cyclase family protein [Paenibacillus spongiae]UVI29549.1 cyclase family protein [Paenibacillus spongiae]
MHRLLSYPLNPHAPGWPGNPKLGFEPVSLIADGEPANTYNLQLFNHFGSHMDGPRHFNDEGPQLQEMPLETFVYERPLLLDIPKSFGELVMAEELQPYETELKNSDLLMIRSGFSSQRSSQPDKYSSEGPGMCSEACKYLMDHCPNLKAIALDWISLASYAHMEDGVLAHQYLLGKFHSHYICIIEDLNFSGLEAGKLKKVVSLPLFVEGIDSAPVTVLAELE